MDREEGVCDHDEEISPGEIVVWVTDKVRLGGVRPSGYRGRLRRGRRNGGCRKDRHIEER